MNSSNGHDAEFFRDRGFGLRLGFGATPAVLAVDFMNAFTDESMPLGSNLDDEISAAQVILEAAREASIPIYHTIVRYDDEGMHDAGVWQRKQAGMKTLVAGTAATDIDDRIARQADEPIIVKKYASAFFGTDLSSRLVSQRIDTLILLGCTTSGCIRASAVDAVQLGFIPVVVREAVGDRSAAAHEQSLFDLEQKYADVVSVTETVDYLSARNGAAQ